MDENVSKSLKGKRVLLTRALEQSAQLVNALAEKGAIPLVLPMVAFAPPDDPSPLEDAIRQLRSYDWVFLTSQNALRALQERCRGLGVNLAEALTSVNIAAVGPATAGAAENAGLRVAYVASKHLGVALAEELAERVKGKRVLLPRSGRANPELVEELNRFGARVFEVCAYKTIRPEKTDSETVTTIAQEGVDAVLFFSPSAVHHLRELLGNERFLELSRRSVFAAIGPVTEDALHNVNVERVVLARETSVNSILETLGDYFVQKCVRGASDPQPGMAVPGQSAGVKRG